MKAILAAAILALAAAGCGGSGSGSSVTMNVTSTGFDPSTVTVRYGYSLVFQNKDSAAHQLSSQSCPDLNTPSLEPGKSFTVSPSISDANKSCDISAPQVGVVQYNGTVRVPAAG